MSAFELSLELGAYAGKSSDYFLSAVVESWEYRSVCSDKYITHLTFIFLQEH